MLVVIHKIRQRVEQSRLTYRIVSLQSPVPIAQPPLSPPALVQSNSTSVVTLKFTIKCAKKGEDDSPWAPAPPALPEASSRTCIALTGHFFSNAVVIELKSGNRKDSPLRVGLQ